MTGRNPEITSQPILELSEATVRREGQNILDRLTLSIREQEHTAIIGPNGSGKSTLIKLLTRQVHPLAPKNGTPAIRVFGKKRWKVAEINTQMGIVSTDLQDKFLNNTKNGQTSGHEVVLSGFFAGLRIFPYQQVTEKMHQQAEDALKRMDAESLSDKMIIDMSTGEARRVLIARALVTQPRVLVLDEPTTALDFVARHHFMQRIQEIAKQGTTIIIVTHHIQEVIPETRQVILLQDGHAVFNGPTNEVLTTEKVSQVFDHPVQIQQKNGLYDIMVNH